MELLHKYFDKHKERFLKELIEWLSIPSVSADQKFKDDVFEAAEFAQKKLLAAGVDRVEICPTNGYPIVYAEKIVDKKLPTVLIYGHYDVQPADPYELWDSPPFDPVIKNEIIYARGSSDDKGQVYMHIKALECMNAAGTIPCNIKFMIEGEEEVGSENLGTFISNNKKKLAADVVLISDTSMLANDVPSITTGLRGLSYMQVEVTGPNRDLHSGVYGGSVANPVNVLCNMIASLVDNNGRITIPGFYDHVKEVSAAERAEMAKAPFNLEDYKRELGVQAVSGEAGYSSVERTSIRPSLDVNGIWGGYIAEGAKTVLPSKAYAKISMRLVPEQNSERIAQLFTKYIHKIAPETVQVNVLSMHGGEAVVTPINSIAYKAASMAFKQTFGKAPIPVRSGGSIPIVALFEKELGLKSILMGFGLDSDNIHSPNEHFGVFNFYKGIETIPWFFKFYAEMK